MATTVVLLALCCSAAEAGIYWSAPTVIDSVPVQSLSCPSNTLCVGIDGAGNVLTSTDPTGGAHAWGKFTIAAGERLDAVSCAPSPGLICIAAGEKAMFTSSDPTGGPSAWNPIAGASGAAAVSCPSASFCAASEGDELISTVEPANPAATWKSTYVGRPLGALSCASATFCGAVDAFGGTVYAFSEPAAKGSGFTTQVLSGAALNAISCPTAHLCVAVGDETEAYLSYPPGGWGASRSLTALPHPAALACATEALCVAAGQNGTADDTEQPVPGWTWHSTEGVDGNKPLSAVACPSESLCLAAGEALVVGVPSHTLSVAVNDSAGGNVTSSPIACPFGCTFSGIECPQNCTPGTYPGAMIPQRLAEVACGAFQIGVDPGICSLDFPYQDDVALTATPRSKAWTFAGWGGECAGRGSCNVTMSEDRHVTATFRSVPPPPGPFYMSHLEQSRRRWHEGRLLPKVLDTYAPPPPKLPGTTFFVGVNEASTLYVRFERYRHGLVLDGSCRLGARARAGSRARRCVGRHLAGRLALPVEAGPNQIRFDGRLSQRIRLPLGSYRASFALGTGPRRAGPKHLRFTIVG